MPNHRQSVRSFPCAKQPYLLEYGTHMVKLEEILIHFKTITPNKFKNKGNTVNKGTYWFFQDHLDSFQDHCLNHCKFNIFWLHLVQTKPKQVSTIKFQISQPIVPHRSIVATYEQIWWSVKTHTKSMVTSTIRVAGHWNSHQRWPL